MIVTVTVLTHPGSVRAGNEDSVVVGPWICAGPGAAPTTLVLRGAGPVVCAVADGLGGHEGGEVASDHVARGLAAAGPGLLDEDSVARALARLHAELYDRMDREPRLVGMGTTVAGLVLFDDRVVSFNVGDSRTFQVEGGYLGQMSIDDSPAGLGPGETSPVVTQSLGGTRRPAPLTPHLATNAAGHADRFLLCTDGLTDVVGLDDIERALKEDDCATTLAMLTTMALRAGAPDNFSVLVVDVSPVRVP